LQIIEQILEFLFSGSGTLPEQSNSPFLVFAISSGIIGVFVVIVDYLVSLIPRDSFLKLTHSLARLPLFIAIWGLGAAVVSFFGVAFHILETTLQAAVVAGIAWPVLMTRIVSSAGAAAELEETGEAEETEE